MASKKKTKEKKKDFVKQKLKVGKATPKASNATDTSFTARTLSVPKQNLGQNSLKNQLSLLKHHQAPIRKQAVIYITENFHLHPSQLSTMISAVMPLIVDGDLSVRQSVLKFLKSLDNLDSFIPMILLYIHSAMTHITPSIRAESTLFLDVLLDKNPRETVRQGFVRTLELFMTLFGFSNVKQVQAAGSIATTTMGFGKTASKTKLTHIKSLQTLLNLGLENDTEKLPNIFHSDSMAFLVPEISFPYSFGSRVITEDSQARRLALEQFQEQLRAGLHLSVKEGGEIGRIAVRLLEKAC